MHALRRDRIGYLILKHQMKEKGVRLTPNFKREIGNWAKAIGISTEEAMEFVEFVVRELVEETFAPETNRE